MGVTFSRARVIGVALAAAAILAAVRFLRRKQLGDAEGPTGRRAIDMEQIRLDQAAIPADSDKAVDTAEVVDKAEAVDTAVDKADAVDKAVDMNAVDDDEATPDSDVDSERSWTKMDRSAPSSPARSAGSGPILVELSSEDEGDEEERPPVAEPRAITAPHDQHLQSVLLWVQIMRNTPDIVTAFEAFDSSKDGRISQAELVSGPACRRRDCHFDGTPSLSLLKRLPKVEGGAAE